MKTRIIKTGNKEGILGVAIAPSVQVKNGKLYYRKEKRNESA